MNSEPVCSAAQVVARLLRPDEQLLWAAHAHSGTLVRRAAVRSVLGALLALYVLGWAVAGGVSCNLSFQPSWVLVGLPLLAAGVWLILAVRRARRRITTSAHAVTSERIIVVGRDLLGFSKVETFSRERIRSVHRGHNWGGGETLTLLGRRVMAYSVMVNGRTVGSVTDPSIAASVYGQTAHVSSFGRETDTLVGKLIAVHDADKLLQAAALSAS